LLCSLFQPADLTDQRVNPLLAQLAALLSRRNGKQ
jgi:hypothetical protein